MFKLYFGLLAVSLCDEWSHVDWYGMNGRCRRGWPVCYRAGMRVGLCQKQAWSVRLPRFLQPAEIAVTSRLHLCNGVLERDHVCQCGEVHFGLCGVSSALILTGRTVFAVLTRSVKRGGDG
jgi:hypothetical protein